MIDINKVKVGDSIKKIDGLNWEGCNIGDKITIKSIKGGIISISNTGYRIKLENWELVEQEVIEETQQYLVF